jgi:hypothetical protein
MPTIASHSAWFVHLPCLLLNMQAVVDEGAAVVVVVVLIGVGVVVFTGVADGVVAGDGVQHCRIGITKKKKKKTAQRSTLTAGGNAEQPTALSKRNMHGCIRRRNNNGDIDHPAELAVKMPLVASHSACVEHLPDLPPNVHVVTGVIAGVIAGVAADVARAVVALSMQHFSRCQHTHTHTHTHARALIRVANDKRLFRRTTFAGNAWQPLAPADDAYTEPPRFVHAVSSSHAPRNALNVHLFSVFS